MKVLESLLKFLLFWVIIFYLVVGVGQVYSNFKQFDWERYKLNKQTERAFSIYKKLAVNVGVNRLPLFIVDKNPEENAAANEEMIIVNTGLIENAKNDDEIALVIAHELGHFMLKHTKEGVDESAPQPEQEAQADKIGAYLMLRSGYDICKGMKIFERWREQGPECSFCGSHPNNSYRLYQLEMPWCAL